MSRVNVVVAATSPDIQAEGILAAIAQRRAVKLTYPRVVATEEVAVILDGLPSTARCAVVLVGPPKETDAAAADWLATRTRLVVLCVPITEDLVRIAVRDAGLDALLAALQELADRADRSAVGRLLEFQFQSLPAVVPPDPPRSGVKGEPYPVMTAVSEWVHSVLRVAVGKLTSNGADPWSASVGTTSIADQFEHRVARTPAPIAEEEGGKGRARWKVCRQAKRRARGHRWSLSRAFEGTQAIGR